MDQIGCSVVGKMCQKRLQRKMCDGCNETKFYIVKIVLFVALIFIHTILILFKKSSYFYINAFLHAIFAISYDSLKVIFRHVSGVIYLNICFKRVTQTYNIYAINNKTERKISV